MHIDKALTLKVGISVSYPADRGIPAGRGRVEHVGTDVQTNIHGDRYVWVLVRQVSGHASSWPSNRLS